MGNHHHFVLRTHRPNLSRLMRPINGVCSQRFNRRHGLVGHLLQGRFKAILVQADTYLLQVCRYVELNPVRAGLVDPAAWPWMSCSSHIGLGAGPACVTGAARPLGFALSPRTLAGGVHRWRGQVLPLALLVEKPGLRHGQLVACYLARRVQRGGKRRDLTPRGRSRAVQPVRGRMLSGLCVSRYAPASSARSRRHHERRKRNPGFLRD